MRYIPAPWREPYVKNALKAKPCIFCEALKRKAGRKSLILYKGKQHFILLNKFPYTTGHLMIAPFRHTAAYERTSPKSAAELADLLRRAIRILQTQYHPHGFNVGMNLGRCAGAGVADHYHLHVIPRWPGDSNFLPLISRTKIVTEDLETTCERLRPRFEKKLRRPNNQRSPRKANPSPSR